MKKLRIVVDIAAPPDALELLQEGTNGHELIISQTAASSDQLGAEQDSQFAAMDVFFGQLEPAVIEQARQLKWIHVSSSGITRYDNPGFRALMVERGILMSNSASVYNEACAVHVLSFMLAQARKLPLALKTRTASDTKTWQVLRVSSRTLRGETVLILGYGAIGKRLVELLQPFDMNVVAFRRKPRGNEGVAVITQERLAQALGEADHVINILPDSGETRDFFDRGRFASVKPGAVFYNIGRGTTVDQDALLESLRAGHLGAAWLDVTEPEPLPANHPLWSQANCFITPHVAGGHTDEGKTLVRHFLKNLDRFVRNEPLLDRVM
jgi:phosphoglycerate dehydrogenase-like enzyme